MLEATAELSCAVSRFRFGPPVTHVYNPLDYAWKAHEAYLRNFGSSRKKIVFLGMNPGPFGMVQTSVPFGEVATVRDWLGIVGGVVKPKREHPKRPIEGFECQRSEVSGRRLWGLFRERFVDPDSFFKDHFVLNYCPLAFLEESGRNRTPDKLPASESRKLAMACDRHLRKIIRILEPQWLIGVGGFAVKRAETIFGSDSVRIGQILHPSPASPAANRDWKGQAERQLEALEVWGKGRGTRGKGAGE